MKLFLCSHFSSVGSLIKEEIENKKVAFIPTASLRKRELVRVRPFHLACGKMEGPRPDKFRFVESSIAYCEQKKQSCECMILSRIDKTAQNQYNKT